MATRQESSTNPVERSWSKSDGAAAFELQDLARLVRSGNGEAHPLDDLPHGADLRGVRFGELAGSEPQAVLETDTHVAPHPRRHGRDRQLVAPRAQHAPPVLVAEQAIRRAFHVRDIVRMRTDATENAEHTLDEKRRLDHPAVEEMLRRIEVADVVALDLEARGVARAGGKDVLDVRERVADAAVCRTLEIGPLPIVLEGRETRQHRKQSEVHRAHVERGDL